jgi:hypothetical protein
VIQAGIKTLRSELTRIENYIWDKKELPPKTESVFLAVNNSLIKQIAVNIQAWYRCQTNKKNSG